MYIFAKRTPSTPSTPWTPNARVAIAPSVVLNSQGIQVQDADGNALAHSTAAAKSAITQVVFSRVGMAMPGEFPQN